MYLKKFWVLSFFVCLIFSNGISQQEQAIETEVTGLKDDLSSKELQTFANIYQQVQIKNKEAQQEMVQTIKDEGLSVKRYQALTNQKEHPDGEVSATAEEKEILKALGQSFTEIQDDFKVKITSMIKEEGMSVKRYQEVYQMVRQDKSLQQELGEIMNG